MRNSTSGKVGQAALASTPVLALALLAMPLAQAQTFTVLYTFTGGLDGGTPLATPILYNGNVYGTTASGGRLSGSTYCCGTVYELNFESRHEAVLHPFTGGAADGGDPIGGLIQDSSFNFYGVAYRGGAHNFGTVFKLSPAGAFTLLHSFAGPTSEGSGPAGTPAFDPFGNLFGTTYTGGSAAGFGTVFEITSGGVYSTGQSFPPDGALPRAGLHLEGGKLYGTTTGGGARGNAGTVYAVQVATPLYAFTGGADGATPMGGLVGDGVGNLYGTTSAGGSGSFGGGSGVVFELNIATGQETVLHTFTGGDGSTPAAGLARDALGNLYGTTLYGGASGYGTVFKLDTSGNLTTLHSFTGGADGASAFAGLIVDGAGNIWGAASTGGAAQAPGGYGTLFIISPPAPGDSPAAGR